jgi:hypothetical protein
MFLDAAAMGMNLLASFLNNSPEGSSLPLQQVTGRVFHRIKGIRITDNVREMWKHRLQG